MTQFYRIEIYYNVASMWTLEVIGLRWTMRWISTWPISMKPAFRLTLRLKRIWSRKSSKEGVSEGFTTRSFSRPCLEQEEQYEVFKCGWFRLISSAPVLEELDGQSDIQIGGSLIQFGMLNITCKSQKSILMVVRFSSNNLLVCIIAHKASRLLR